jgi:glycosyltransferase involved in cell wall biosynthesis
MDTEVWVCDGMSDDGTREEVSRFTKEHPWIKLVGNPARTTPQAMNLGLRPEGYEVGIILGAHAEVDAAFLQENIALLQAHPEAGCVGGVIENVYLDAASRRIGAAMGHPFGVGSAHFRTGRKEGEVDTVAFDERLVRNQDDEFNYRVLRSGWKIRLSQRIRSKYYVRAGVRKLFRQYKQYGYWKVYVNRLHGSITTWRQLVPAAFVLYLIVGAAMAFVHPYLAWAYLAGLLVYLAGAVLSAVQAAPSVADVPGTLLAFLVLHLSYGIGYLQGVVELVLLGREPKATAHRLTR